MTSVLFHGLHGLERLLCLIPQVYIFMTEVGVSIDGGTPSHHPFVNGILPEINHPASLGYPNDYGNPQIRKQKLTVSMPAPFPSSFSNLPRWQWPRYDEPDKEHSASPSWDNGDILQFPWKRLWGEHSYSTTGWWNISLQWASIFASCNCWGPGATEFSQ